MCWLTEFKSLGSRYSGNMHSELKKCLQDLVSVFPSSTFYGVVFSLKFHVAANFRWQRLQTWHPLSLCSSRQSTCLCPRSLGSDGDPCLRPSLWPKKCRAPFVSLNLLPAWEPRLSLEYVFTLEWQGQIFAKHLFLGLLDILMLAMELYTY